MNKNKKYLILVIILIILFMFVSKIYNKKILNDCINNTNDNSDKINYNTNILFTINTDNVSSKINYKLERYYEVKVVNFSNYVNDKIQNSVKKYIVGNNTYVLDGNTYKKQDNKEEFDINYSLLKNKIKSYKNNKYIIKMKSYDAYNLLYNKEIMKKDDTNYNVDVNIIIDKKNKFIKELFYEIKIDNISYNIKISNSNINNKEKIELPFEIN